MKCQMSMGREFGITILLFLLPLMVVLGSCSTYNAINVMEKLDKTFRAYGNIIRWEKFETASLFAASSIHDEFEKRVKDAKNVVVVDYRIINVEYGEGGKKATVNAEISYHTLSSNLVRTLIDKQMWVYGEEKGSKQWRLLTLLPEFK